MERLTEEKIELLNRLYNLSSDDNVVIAEINNNINSLDKQIESTEDSKKGHEQEKTNIEKELEVFTKQSKEFLDVFGKYTNTTFESLRSIDIDLELGTIVGKVKKSVPEREDYLNNLINNEKTSIMDCNNRLEELNRERTRSKEELQNAQTLKERLSNLIEDVLVNNNISSYTRGFIKRILSEFKLFNDDEITELEFLILFPENGLRLYEDYKSNIGIETPNYEIDSRNEEDTTIETPTIEIEPEEKEEPVIELVPTVEEEPVEEQNDIEETTEAESYTLPLVEETEEAKTYEVEAPIIEIKTEEEPAEMEIPSEEKEEIPIEVPTIEVEESPEDKIIKELEENGISLDGYDKYLIASKFKDIDIELIKKNYELLRSINIDDVLTNEYLKDEELFTKVTTLRSKGINDKLIKELILKNSLKISNDTLTTRIELIGEIKEDNLHLLNSNIELYNENINKLATIGIELDDKETRNYRSILENCKDIDSLITVFTTYLLNLSKANGKYALNILLSEPKELIFNIDDLIEKGLENQINETPEIFNYNIDTILKRIKYCLDNNIPVYDEEDKTINNYIIEARLFNKEYKDAVLNELIDRETINNKIKESYNNPYTTRIIDSLDNYYNNYYEVELDENEETTLEELIHIAEQEMNYQVIGKSTYTFNGTYISKNKLERNLSVLIKEKILDENEKHLTILCSSLYNLREENIEEVINTSNN